MVAHTRDASLPRLGFTSILTLVFVVLAAVFLGVWLTATLGGLLLALLRT